MKCRILKTTRAGRTFFLAQHKRRFMFGWGTIMRRFYDTPNEPRQPEYFLSENAAYQALVDQFRLDAAGIQTVVREFQL